MLFRYEDDIQTTNRVSTPSSTKQTTRNKSTTYVSKTVTSSSKTVQSTTEESASENVTEAGERLTQSQGSGAGIPIGVSTAVVLIIIAVVITFAILKRRGKVPNVCTNTNSSANSDNTKAIPPVNKNIYDTSIGPSYDQIGNVVSQQNIDINTDSDLNNSNYAHTYFVLEQHVRETEYGATASGKDDREMENTNDYNTLTLHTNYKTKNGMHVVDDTYDTTAKADKKLKDGIDKETYKLDDTDEDTYNHINNTHLKNSKTDNVYGVPDNLEYGYGNVGKNIKNKTHGEEGTYSHINN
ncbi:uncharacterized protein LOC128553071 [Mercenaria mercenaria]|uniref:uncharacterized protein LOC128553071 n=1 Tax=Mercenaria mercenaria TaxID=6596 RepID=UPI00234EC091|nr:uncharacterized protein LOC128553071 [Mercenaria mercenaria]